MESVLEKMERIDGKRKIADFIIKQKMDYNFKVKYGNPVKSGFSRAISFL